MTANSINTDPSKPKVKETVVNTKTTDLKAVKEPSKQEKTMNYIIYGVGAGFILLFIGLAIFLLMPADNSKKKAPAKDATMVASVPEPVTTQPPPYLASFENNPNGWYFQPQPFDSLVDESIKKAIDSSPYNQGGILVSPSGTQMTPNSPEYFTVVNGIRESQKAKLMQEYPTEPRGAYQQIYHLDTVAGNRVAISDPNDILAIENQTAQDIATQLNNGIISLPAPAKEQNQKIEPKVIDMTEEQRQRYMSLIQNLRDWNHNLQVENADLKKQLAQQEKGMTHIIQKLEDSPTANERLRATMLPKSTGLRTEAMVGGRAWVRDTKTGALYSLEVGSVIPITELRVAELKEDTGIVMVTRK